MATIYAVVSPESKIHIKTEVLSPQMLARTPGQVRPLRPINKDGEPGKVRRQLAMNANKGNPVINNRRNARERNRVKQVNQGFAFLRSHLPLSPDNKKVSKVDTLRTAIEYIQGLTDLLMDSDRYDSSSVSPGSYMLKPDSDDAMTGLVSNPPPYHHHLQPSPSAAASVFQTTPSGFCLSPASFAGFGSEALAGLTATAPLLEPPPSYNDSIRELQLSREHHQLSLVEEPSSSSAASPVSASVATSMPEASVAGIPDHDFLSALRWWQGSTAPGNQP